MAYDMMQAAAVMQVVRDIGTVPFSTARLLATRLLTETRRSEQQIRLQQFSTPLPYAALVSRAAAIRPGETVLEPSAGAGAMAGFATLISQNPAQNYPMISMAGCTLNLHIVPLIAILHP